MLKLALALSILGFYLPCQTCRAIQTKCEHDKLKKIWESGNRCKMVLTPIFRKTHHHGSPPLPKYKLNSTKPANCMINSVADVILPGGKWNRQKISLVVTREELEAITSISLLVEKRDDILYGISLRMESIRSNLGIMLRMRAGAFVQTKGGLAFGGLSGSSKSQTRFVIFGGGCVKMLLRQGKSFQKEVC